MYHRYHKKSIAIVLASNFAYAILSPSIAHSSFPLAPFLHQVNTALCSSLTNRQSITLSAYSNKNVHRITLLNASCDGSISAPVFHLYNQLCKMLDIDPIATYHSAYDDDRISKRDLSYIIRFAEWQGVEVISKWNEKKIQLVLESIHNVNMHQLANVLTVKL